MKAKVYLTLIVVISVSLVLLNLLYLKYYEIFLELKRDPIFKVLNRSNIPQNDEDLLSLLYMYNEKYYLLYKKYSSKLKLNSLSDGFCSKKSNVLPLTSYDSVKNIHSIPNSPEYPSIFFLKTHKTCSTTTTSLLWRLFCRSSNQSYRHKWNCFLPTPEHAGRTFDFGSSRDVSYILADSSSTMKHKPLDIWLSHAWIPNLYQSYDQFSTHKNELQSSPAPRSNALINLLMKRPQTFLSIIRQPSKRLRSSWSWYHLKEKFNYSFEALEEKLTSYSANKINFSLNWMHYLEMPRDVQGSHYSFIHNLFTNDLLLKQNKNLDSITQELLGLKKYPDLLKLFTYLHSEPRATEDNTLLDKVERNLFSNFDRKYFLSFLNNLSSIVFDNYIFNSLKFIISVRHFENYFSAYKSLLENLVKRKLFLIICERYEESLITFLHDFNKDLLRDRNFLSHLIYSNQKTNILYKESGEKESASLYNITPSDHLQPFDLLLFRMSNLLLSLNLAEISEENKEDDVCELVHTFKLTNIQANNQCQEQKSDFCEEINKSNRDNIVEFHSVK